MDRLRYEIECALFRKCGLPDNTYCFRNVGQPDTHLLIAARTNSKHVYTLHFDLAGFPAHMPVVFVKAMLRDRDGNKLDDASAAMHTLPSGHGWTRICHYGGMSWRPNMSLYKVYIKCRLWLEMYELHLQTGKSIDYYLNHQR